MLYKKSCHHLPLMGHSFLESQDQIEYVETEFGLRKHEGKKMAAILLIFLRKYTYF